MGRLISNSLWKIANETKELITFGHCSIIDSLCKRAKVKRVNNDMTLKKGAYMDDKWLKKLTKYQESLPRGLESAPKEKNKEPQEKEKTSNNGGQDKFYDLELHMEN